MQYLLEHELVDELRLMVSPLVLGTGRRVFGETLGKRTFDVVDVQRFATGTLVLTYAPRVA